MQKLNAKLSKEFPSLRKLRKGGPEETASFASPNIHPCLDDRQLN